MRGHGGSRFRRAAVGYSLVVCCAVFASIGIQSFPAAATGSSVITQLDTNNDGHPDITIIDGAFVTKHDRVTVYDVGGNMRDSQLWSGSTDFTDDTWIFDIGADGTAQLIIQFRREHGNDIAYLWDDVNGDGAVAYKVVGDTVQVTESPFWTLRIEADGSWLLPDGSPNYALTWKMNGCGECSAIPASARNQLLPQFARDGKPDYTGGIHVDANSGIPTYIYSVMLTPISKSYGFPRSLVHANPTAHRPADPSGYLFWPLLAGPSTPRASRYWDDPPYIYIDWTKGRIVGPSQSFR